MEPPGTDSRSRATRGGEEERRGEEDDVGWLMACPPAPPPRETDDISLLLHALSLTATGGTCSKEL